MQQKFSWKLFFLLYALFIVITLVCFAIDTKNHLTGFPHDVIYFILLCTMGLGGAIIKLFSIQSIGLIAVLTLTAWAAHAVIFMGIINYIGAKKNVKKVRS